MKKLLSLSVVPIMVAMLLISSCDKKKDPTPTKEQLLAHSAGWKTTSYTVNGVEVFNDDDFFDACERDNIYKFTQTGSTSNGTITIDEGATKCGTDQIVGTGVWTLSSNKTTLTITGDGDPLVFTISTLTTTSFSITDTYEEQGQTYTEVQTFIGL